MNSKRLKILFVTSHCPFAPSYGTQVRMLNIARQLKNVGDVSFVVTDNYDRDLDSRIESFEFEIKLIAGLVPSPRRRVGMWLAHELNSDCLATEGFEVREADRQTMNRLLSESDLCWIHGLQTANMFGVYNWPRSVLDIDDIPSRFFASRAKDASGVPRKVLDYRRSVLWRNRERVLAKRFSMVATVSERDRRYLGGGAHLRIIPNGFDPPAIDHPRTTSDPPRIGFIGTLNWTPNRSGIEWFIRDAWPHVKRDIPTVRLRLIGQGSKDGISSLGSDIDGLGWVDDPASEISSWSAMIVPVRSGAGTRVKIVEAFSKRCPVISTNIGAFGYEVSDGEDILLADDAQEFASACARILKDSALGTKLSDNAWNKYKRQWTWEAIGGSVIEAVKQCIGKRVETNLTSETANAD